MRKVQAVTAKQIAQRIHLLRVQNRVGPRQRGVRQRYPHLIEVQYGSLLVGYVDRIRAALQPLIDLLPQLAHTVNERRDAHESDRVAGIIDDVRRRVLSREQMSVVVAAYARRIAEHQRAEFARAVKAALGVDIALLGVEMSARAARLADFTAENVSLIRSLTTTPLDEVERLIVRAFAAGDRHEDIAKEIEHRFNVARSRARLIARDQVGKLNAQVGRDANKSIGLNQFRWRSVRDKSVRPQHQEWDRKSKIAPFSYDGTDGYRPPELPGEAVQCRCYDEAVFDAILAEVDALEPKRRRA